MWMASCTTAAESFLATLTQFFEIYNFVSESQFSVNNKLILTNTRMELL